jgi:hypothetical protein
MVHSENTESVSGRGGLTLVFFIVIAALLFFIPELLSFRKTFSGEAKKEEVVSNEPSKASSVRSPRQRLEKVLLELESEDGDVIFPEGQVDLEGLSPDRRKIGEMLRAEPVSWRILKKKSVRSLVSGAQKEIVALFKRLNESQYPKTRFSLINYSNALTAFLRGDAKLVPAEAYLSYLTQLDIAVSDSMIDEGMQEPEFKRWRGISLAPLVVQGTAYMRRQYSPPFYADVVLTEVYVRKHLERADRPTYYSVRGRGYVIGSAATDLDVVRNGKRESTIKLSPNYERKRFTFALVNVSGDPVVALRVRDEFHRSRIKRYRFIRAATSYPLGSDGIYQVPVSQRVDKDEVMPRFTDRVFAFGRGTSLVAGTTEGKEPVGLVAAANQGLNNLGVGGFSTFKERPGDWTSF